MRRSLCVLVAFVSLLTNAQVTFASETVSPAQTTKDQETLWKLERAYWQYVQDSDLAAYSNLWHKDFLGWPAVTAAPVHKDHITDWITLQTSKGLKFKTDEFKPAAIQVTRDVATVYYWITFRWLDQDGKGEARTFRISHAWVRSGNDWRIIGGMSMPAPQS